MKKLVKNLLTLSLTFAMMGICVNLLANNPDETEKKAKKNVKTPESEIQKLIEKRAKVSNCIEDFDENSLKLLMKDRLLLRDKKGYKYNKAGKNRKEDYRLVFKSVEKVDDTTYYAVSEFDVYTMKTTIDADKKGSGRKNNIKYNILPKGTVVTRPDTPKEAADKLAKQLTVDQELALKELESYKNNSASILDLSEDYKIAETAINAAETSEEVKMINENALASMKEKVNAAIVAADNAKKLINNEEATIFVNNYARQLASYTKNANNIQEIVSMFANEDVEVGVSTLTAGSRIETVADYLNKLSEISNKTYKNNIELNVNIENVELFGNKAVVKVIQNFDGNGIYCDVTTKSIELVKENEKITINKIEVLDTQSCK